MQLSYIIFVLTLLLFAVIIWGYFLHLRHYTYENLTNNELGLAARVVLRSSKKKMKAKDPATRIYNKYVYGNVLEHHILPNTVVDNILPEINNVYTDVLEDIRANPGVINSNLPVDINTVIDHAEEFTNTDAEEVREAVREARYREEYFDQTNIKNDPQNVHESEVVNEFSARYKEIKRVNGPPAPISELRDIAHGNEKAIKAINLISPIVPTKSKVSNIIPLGGDNESMILQHVWTRINDPENAGSKQDMVNILLSNLSSIYEKKTPVCPMGRVTRLLDVFTLIDANPLISAPVKTSQVLRNEIFEYSQRYVREQMETDTRFRDYMNGLSDDNSMIPAIHAEIERNIRAQYPHVLPKVLNNIINDVHAGIE